MRAEGAFADTEVWVSDTGVYVITIQSREKESLCSSLPWLWAYVGSLHPGKGHCVVQKEQRELQLLSIEVSHPVGD